MVRHDYSKSQYDNCVYHKKFSDGAFICLLLYVDDMLIASHSKSSINDLKALLKSEFEMKDLVASKKILGMEIQRDLNADKLFLNQHSYIKKFYSVSI